MSNVVQIKVPDIGGFKEVEVIEVLVAVGDTIKAEQSLITVESDKASMEIPASQGGVVKSIAVKVGDKVAEGAVVLEVEEGASAEAAAPKAEAKEAPKQAAAAGKNREEGNAFLAKNKAQPGVVTTASGLQYQVLRAGSGERPMATSRVRVNYEGKLLDGTPFDSSYERGQPADFGLDQVIKGWTEGVALMPVGSKYRFWVPSELAYGSNGTPGGPIGPDATLTFDVELLGILQ